MRLRLRLLLPVLALLLAVPAAAHAAESPPSKALYQDGPEGRYLLDGSGCSASTTPIRASSSASCAARRRAAGRKVTVPNVWNLGDPSNESMAGGIGWYRKDFELPERGLRAGVGAALRVGQLPHAGVAQRHAGGREHRRLHPVRDVAKRAQAQRARTGSSCASTRAGKITDFPPARPEHRRRARPAAGGTTPASSARSTCASWTRSTSRRSRCAR